MTTKSNDRGRVYEGHVELDCPNNCGGVAQGTGMLATGAMLSSGHTPEPGELVKIIYISCDRCGWDQAS